jgi:hypothetical protein
MVDIATGAAEDREPTPEEQGKNAAAVALGRKGGAARAKAMTKEQRSEIAQKAAQKRDGRANSVVGGAPQTLRHLVQLRS